MNHKLSEEDDIVRIMIEGDVIGGPDAKTPHDLIHDLIGKNKTKIVLDLAKVELMNSSGLGILISALTTARQAKGDVLLMNVTDRIQNLLSITKLNSVFKSYESFDSVKDHFN